MEFVRVRLQAPQRRLPSLGAFYADELGLGLSDSGYALGATELVFYATPGDPFYHFAILVPGDRFEAALKWASERVRLLPGGDIDEVVFDFENWNALACYFHDPAGNIVELIAHRGLGENGATGAFSPSELLGFSELGLVGDPKEIAASLGRIGLRLWDGTLDEPGRLAFIGERAKTLILSPEGRGWLPTGQPAVPFPIDVILTGAESGEVTVAGHRVRREQPLG
jgi:hypothetical protein